MSCGGDGWNGRYGWVEPGTVTPAHELLGNDRYRNDDITDPRLASLTIVNGYTPPQFAVAAPNGTYDVTVSVGDAALYGWSKVVVNGVLAIKGFHSTAEQPFNQVTVTATVTDGILRLDAAPAPGNRANSRWDYVDIAQVS